MFIREVVLSAGKSGLSSPKGPFGLAKGGMRTHTHTHTHTHFFGRASHLPLSRVKRERRTAGVSTAGGA